MRKKSTPDTAKILRDRLGSNPGDLPVLKPGDPGYESFQRKLRMQAVHNANGEIERKRLYLRHAREEALNPFLKIPEKPTLHAIDSFSEYARLLAEWDSYISAPISSDMPPSDVLEAPAEQETPAKPDVPTKQDVPAKQSTQHPYIAYLQKLFKPNDRICIMGIHSTRKYAPGKAETHSFFQSLEMTVAADSLPTLNNLQAEGWNLYVCMNSLVAGAMNRKKDRVAELRSVYCEADDNGLAVRDEVKKAIAAGEIPPPHFVIESSPNKFQFVWLVEGFATTAQQEQMNSSLQVRFNTDAQSVDCVRVLRLPGFKNLKPAYGPDFPVSRIVGRKNAPRYRPEDFKIKIVDPVRDESYRPPIASEEINKILDFVTEAMDETSVGYGEIKELPSGTLRIHLDECLWADEHSEGKRGDADVFVNSDGSLGFSCFHSHCKNRMWTEFRAELESRAGHKLKFGESGAIVCEEVTTEQIKKMLEEAGYVPQPVVSVAPVEQPANTPAELPPAQPKDEKVAENNSAEQPTKTTEKLVEKPPTEIKAAENNPEERVPQSQLQQVPPYDKNLVRGIYREVVELVAGGTSMPVQFPHLIAKTFIGLRAAVQGINFEGCDAEPRFYALDIGDTGCGKGWAMRRSRQLFTNLGKELPANRGAQGIKIWDGADSGAGLKECFFDPPANAGVLLYFDETIELGQKARGDRNPEIFSVLLELAEGTSISRGLKDKDKRKRKDDARLAMVMCVQPDIIPMAFAGIKTGTLGFFDRITPEFSTPVIPLPGKTPKMEDIPDKVEKFYAKYLALDFSKMLIKPGGFAETRIEDYWRSLPLSEQTQVRRKRNLYLDHFMIQLGLMAGCKTVKDNGETSLQDADDAIANDQRQATIRHLYMSTEVTDKISEYLAKLKTIRDEMLTRLKRGDPSELVELTEAQCVKRTNAYRLNEQHLFDRAWRVFARLYFVGHPKANDFGPKTVAYLPKVEK